MRRNLPAISILFAASLGPSAGQSGSPLRTDSAAPTASNPVDEAVSAALRERGMTPAQPCSDETYLRRLHLDLLGLPPEPREVLDFLADRAPDKREKRVDALLARPEFADCASMKWCDLLRVKSEFPINLWPNAAQAYHGWIHDALRDNLPYDRFARALLTSSGSNVRVPPINFWRAVQGRKPADLAAAVALTFLGARLDKFPKDRADGLAVFFSRIAFKPTSEWKEEIVQPDPAPAAAAEAVFPDGTRVVLKTDDDPREVFANWLVRGDNPWFARAVANRIWAWLLGRGVVHEPDDLRTDNPPAVPGLLEVLQRELVRSNWDLRAVYRLILTSRTYGRSSVPVGPAAESERLFGHAVVRRLDAEVLADALIAILGVEGEACVSLIPEPYTYLPRSTRAVLIPDGSITSSYLELFGRPSRDTGLFSERDNGSTDDQRLFLLNSSVLRKAIQTSPKLREALRGARGKPGEAIRALYLSILSRPPTKEETAAGIDHLKSAKGRWKEAADDLAWALINSKEFLHRH